MNFRQKLTVCVLVAVLTSLFACTAAEVPQPQLQPSIPNKQPKSPPSQPPKQLVIVNQTTHGRIRWNETWRGEVHITGDIIVERGFTLTIEPGTKVFIAANKDEENLFTDAFDMQKGVRPEKPGEDRFYRGVHFGEPFRDEGNHIAIRIWGTLYAVGTPDKMITITSDSSTPTVYDWNFFDFTSGTLSYCLVEYYRCLNPGEGTTVSHNVLRNVGECAICFSDCSLLIEYNELSNAGHELIDMHGKSSSTIRHNQIGPTRHNGFIINDICSPTIVNNTVQGCGNGIAIFGSGSSPTISNNTFKNCGTGILLQTSQANPTITDNNYINCGATVRNQY